MRFDVDGLCAQLVVATLEDEPLHQEVLLLLVALGVDLPQGLTFRTAFLNDQGSAVYSKGLVCTVFGYVFIVLCHRRVCRGMVRYGLGWCGWFV